MKIKLVENININIPVDQIKIFEKTKIVESAGKNYEARGIVESVPFTRYDHVNENMRYYPESTIDVLLKSGVGEGSKCYANHAENEEDVTKLAGIWHNIRKDSKNKVGRADLYCIGDYGQLFLDALKAGSKGEGISTVAWGEFEEDYNELQKYNHLGSNVKIVKASTLDWSSAGDWVSQPSQKVFATLENVKDNNENSSNLNESYTNNSKTNDKLDENIKLQENKKEVYMDKSILKNMVLNEIKRSKNNPNLLEAIQELKEIDCSGDVELTNKIDTAVDAITSKLNESKSNVEKQLNESTTKLNEMTIKYNKLVENYNKASKKIVELNESANLMSSDIKCLVEDCGHRDKDIKCLVEDRKVMIADLKKMVEDRKAMKKDVKGLTAKLKEAEEAIDGYEKEMEKNGIAFDEDDEEKPVELDADGNPIVKVEEPVMAEEEIPAPETLAAPAKVEEPVVEVKEEEMPAPEVLPEVPAEIKEEGDEQELPMQIDPLPTEPVMAEEEDEMMTLDFDNDEEVEELEEEDAFDAFAPAGEENEVMEQPVISEEEMEIEANPANPAAPAEEVKEEEMPAPDMFPTEEPKLEEEEDEDSDEEDEEDEEKVEEPKEEMKESIKFVWDTKKEVKKVPAKAKMVESTIKADLKKFYESQIAKNPSVKAIEKQIMSAKTLLEAFDMVDTFRSRKSDKLVKVTESKKSDNGVIKFKF